MTHGAKQNQNSESLTIAKKYDMKYKLSMKGFQKEFSDRKHWFGEYSIPKNKAQEILQELNQFIQGQSLKTTAALLLPGQLSIVSLNEHDFKRAKRFLRSKGYKIF